MPGGAIVSPWVLPNFNMTAVVKVKVELLQWQRFRKLPPKNATRCLQDSISFLLNCYNRVWNFWLALRKCWMGKSIAFHNLWTIIYKFTRLLSIKSISTDCNRPMQQLHFSFPPSTLSSRRLIIFCDNPMWVWAFSYKMTCAKSDTSTTTK